jgi:hypothetical protein
MTVEHLMCPPPSRRRLTFEMLNEVNNRLTELRHMASFAGEISQDLTAENEHDLNFRLARDQGERLAFCILNVESRIDDLLEFVAGVFNQIPEQR